MRRRQLAAAGIAGVVLLGGGGVAYAQSQGGTGSYRTATASVGDVDQTLTLSGTVGASTRQDLSFGASGTVKKVSVKAGDTVSAGDVLARLDPTALETAVTKARATLAKARAQLETDQTSQADTVTESTTPSTSTGSDSSTPSAGSSSGSSDDSSKQSDSSDDAASKKAAAALQAALKKLAAQQSAVTTAQTAATDAITASKSALAAQADACAVEEPAEPAEPADGDGDDDSTDTPASTGLSDACTKALDDVQAAQDVVAQKQDTLQTALQDLSTTLTAAVKTLGQSGSTGSSGSGSSGSGSGSSGSGSGSEPAASESTTPAASSGGSSSSASGSASGGGSGGGATVTAATLAQDQASIDTAKAELTEAKRALTAAELTAPFSGQVLSVSAAKGDSVADSDVVVVLAGDGATTVSTTVTLDQIDQVLVGQVAAITPAGATEPASGTVTSIGLLPGGTDTTTYPVTIELDGEVAAPEGSTASIQLVIGTATDVVTVPSSAISTGRGTTVTVLTDGQPVVTQVTVGVVGATRTAITKGVTAGQRIVLADLDADLPSGDSTTTSLTGGGAGGFPGGGAGGGRPGGTGGGRG